jgi:hypothetical protein
MRRLRACIKSALDADECNRSSLSTVGTIDRDALDGAEGRLDWKKSVPAKSRLIQLVV